MALFLIPGVLHAVMLPLMSIVNGPIQWQDWLTLQADGLFHTPDSRGWGTLTTQALIGRIAINALAGLLIVSFLALFEEVGWRGWLLPRMKDRIGGRRAVVAVSLIWALWHIPFQLSGIQHIDGVSPVRLALTLPLGTAAAGLIIGWLWLRTESIWLAAIAHGAMNNWGQYAFKYYEGLRRALHRHGSPRRRIRSPDGRRSASALARWRQSKIEVWLPNTTTPRATTATPAIPWRCFATNSG